MFHPLSTAAVITCLLSLHIHTTLGWRYPPDGIEEGFEEHIVTRELNCNREPGFGKQEKTKEPGFGGKKGSCDVGIPAKEGE